MLRLLTARLAPRWTRGLAAQKFPVPAMGDSITEGTVVAQLKKVGDHVALEEVLASVETDKVTVEVRSPAAGTVTAWFAADGENVIVGEDFIEIDVGVGDASAAAPPPPANAAPASAAEAAPSSAAPAAAAPASAPETDARMHPGGHPSLIHFRSQGPSAAVDAVPDSAASAAAPPAPPAAPAPARPAAAAGSKGQVLSSDELPARFRRLPMSEAEMAAVESGGADQLW